MGKRFLSTLGVIAMLGGLLGLAATPASAQCLANEIQKLTASDATPSDHFGTSVRIIGDLVVVGANAGGDLANSGAAYLFRLDQNTGQWAQEQRITPIDAGVGDDFGISAAINPVDPNVIIVGAYLDDDNGFNSGSAYVFRYNPDSQLWVQEQKLTAWDGDPNDHFGWSVAVWGNVAMIGARLDEDPEPATGSVYVFAYDAPSGTWVQQQKLIPSDTQFNGGFGASLSLQGNVVLIGASTDSEQGFGAGAAYIFRYDPNTQTWLQQQKLLASDGAAGNAFGWWHIALDGDTALIGAYFGSAPPVFGAGAAYVFRFDPDGSGQWVQEQKLTASDAAVEDFFGWSVSLHGDLALVGAILDDDYANGSGSAYIYTFDGKQWSEAAKLRYEQVQGVHAFGVSVSTDGEHVLVGANFTTVDGDAEAGAAYIYGGLGDCNDNGELDLCDIADGFSPDDNNNGIPDECEPPDCPWDLDGDAVVGVPDLLWLLGSWGPCPPKGDCLADFDNTGDVGVKDLLILLGNWGPCP
ncbi:MAG: FG-GAP repeat protein [Planctomycetes bacterium]|nr:FG-GAP repeat protein [Planctomycetota bacterium]